MTKKMLIDATHAEETRVAILDGERLAEYDYESTFRKPLKGNIFLAKVTRVEPSLQAAFVNFGGNRHGFLPFSEIHPDYFRIPIADREALMAEQEAALEEAKKRDEEAEDAEAQDVDDVESSDTEESHIEEIDDGKGEDEVVEEVGGDAPIAPEDSDADEEDADSEGAENAAESDDSENANEDKDEDSAEGEEVEEAEQKSDRSSGSRGRRGRGRGRNNNRGRGRGRTKRAAHSSQRVEVLGGTDYDDEESNDRFRFNLRRKYKIQEVIKRGQIMLVQVSREERGNKGAAVSTYLSLPGRYCVLMPNSPHSGGVSRKISSYADRRKIRDMMKEMDTPKGMSVIVRTAGMQRTKTEIKRDLDYLTRLWNSIRELTLESSAPALVYEEADLIKRCIRDLYTRDIEQIEVSGEDGFNTAKNFMKMMIPSHVKRIKQHKEDAQPLFQANGVEDQINEISEPNATLKSGGYLVINPTEALVSIDVNSGRATKERHIEGTALKTNLEAASEVARQLRLRDLGGLVVIDFIDMEDRRNNAKVERRLKEALSGDRARIQIGRISSFGLLEMSRQRLNPSLTESQFEICENCSGTGRVRTADSTSILLMRAIEDEGAKNRAAELIVHVTPAVAIYVLNNKRENLNEIEARYGFKVMLRVDDSMAADEFRIEVSRPNTDIENDDAVEESSSDDADEEKTSRRRGGRGGRGRGRSRHKDNQQDEDNAEVKSETAAEDDSDDKPAKKTRGRRKSAKQDDQKDDAPVSEEVVEAADEKKDDKPKKDKPKPKPKTSTRKSSAKKTTDKEVKAEDSKDGPAAVEKDEKPAPKKRGRPKKADKSDAEPANDTTQEEAPKDYEVVNEAPEKKKKGWWSLKK